MVRWHSSVEPGLSVGSAWPCIPTQCPHAIWKTPAWPTVWPSPPNYELSTPAPRRRRPLDLGAATQPEAARMGSLAATRERRHHLPRAAHAHVVTGPDHLEGPVVGQEREQQILLRVAGCDPARRILVRQ